MYTTLRDIPPGVTVRQYDRAPGSHVSVTVVRHLADDLTRVRFPDNTVRTMPSYLPVVYIDVTRAFQSLGAYRREEDRVRDVVRKF